METNEQSRIDGLRVAVSILALFALVALLFTGGIPTIQPGAQAKAQLTTDIAGSRTRAVHASRPSLSAPTSGGPLRCSAVVRCRKAVAARPKQSDDGDHEVTEGRDLGRDEGEDDHAT